MAGIVIPVDDILRRWLPTIRKRVNPNEVYHSIRGLTDFDRNRIERAQDREGPQIAADRMVDAIRRRDQRSGFLSFLAALYEHEYSHLADEILASYSILNEQPIQNALDEERARIQHPPYPYTVPTANITPIQNPPNYTRQINNPPNAHQLRMQQYYPHIAHHMAGGFQHRSNQPAQLGHTRGLQNNPDLASLNQYMGTQVPQQYPDNHANLLVQYPGDQVIYQNLQSQNSGNIQRPPSCNMPSLPNQSSYDQNINNTQAMPPQTNTPTSGQQQPLDHDKDIDDIPYDEFEKLVNTLNEQPQPGWKTLATEFKIPRGKVKEFSRSENPAEKLLDYLHEEKKITVRDLKSHLQNAGLNNASRCIQCEDLPSENANQIDDKSDKTDKLQNLSLVPEQLAEGTQVLYSREPESSVLSRNQTCVPTMDQTGAPSIDQTAHTGSSSTTNAPSQNMNTMDDGNQSIMSEDDNQVPDNTVLVENGQSSVNTSLYTNSPGSSSRNNIPVESENRSLTGNSLENNTVPSENDVYNNLNRQNIKNNVPDKTVKIENQPTASKSDSIAMKITQEVLEESPKSIQNGATPSDSDLQVPKASQVTSSPEAKNSQKEQKTTEFSEIHKKNDHSDQPSSLRSQRTTLEQSDMSLIVDGKPESQKEIEQQISTVIDADVDIDGAEYGIQVTSVGGLTDNPNIASPLTNVLTGNNSDKQGATSLSNTKEKNNCPDEEATDDKIGDPVQVTSMDGRTDNQYIADPLTKALYENDNGDNTEKLKNKGTVKQECDVLDVTSDQEGTDYPVQVTSLGGKTDNPNNAADLTKALSKNSDRAQSRASSLDTDTTEKKSIVSDPNANSGAVTENNEQTHTELANPTQETSEEPSIRNCRDIRNSNQGRAQSEEQTGSGTSSNLSIVETRASASTSGRTSENIQSSDFRDIQHSIPSRTQSADQRTSGGVHNLPAVELRPSESLSLTSTSSSQSENVESAGYSFSSETVPKERNG